MSSQPPQQQEGISLLQAAATGKLTSSSHQKDTTNTTNDGEDAIKKKRAERWGTAVDKNVSNGRGRGGRGGGRGGSYHHHHHHRGGGNSAPTSLVQPPPNRYPGAYTNNHYHHNHHNSATTKLGGGGRYSSNNNYSNSQQLPGRSGNVAASGSSQQQGGEDRPLAYYDRREGRDVDGSWFTSRGRGGYHRIGGGGGDGRKIAAICIFWLKNGKCEKPNCKFLHHDPDVPGATSSNVGGGNGGVEQTNDEQTRIQNELAARRYRPLTPEAERRQPPKQPGGGYDSRGDPQHSDAAGGGGGGGGAIGGGLGDSMVNQLRDSPDGRGWRYSPGAQQREREMGERRHRNDDEDSYSDDDDDDEGHRSRYNDRRRRSRSPRSSREWRTTNFYSDRHYDDDDDDRYYGDQRQYYRGGRGGGRRDGGYHHRFNDGYDNRYRDSYHERNLKTRGSDRYKEEERGGDSRREGLPQHRSEKREATTAIVDNRKRERHRSLDGSTMGEGHREKRRRFHAEDDKSHSRQKTAPIMKREHQAKTSITEADEKKKEAQSKHKQQQQKYSAPPVDRREYPQEPFKIPTHSSIALTRGMGFCPIPDGPEFPQNWLKQLNSGVAPADGRMSTSSNSGASPLSAGPPPFATSVTQSFEAGDALANENKQNSSSFITTTAAQGGGASPLFGLGSPQFASGERSNTLASSDFQGRSLATATVCPLLGVAPTELPRATTFCRKTLSDEELSRPLKGSMVALTDLHKLEVRRTALEEKEMEKVRTSVLNWSLTGRGKVYHSELPWSSEGRKHGVTFRNRPDTGEIELILSQPGHQTYLNKSGAFPIHKPQKGSSSNSSTRPQPWVSSMGLDFPQVIPWLRKYEAATKAQEETMIAEQTEKREKVDSNSNNTDGDPAVGAAVSPTRGFTSPPPPSLGMGLQRGVSGVSLQSVVDAFPSQLSPQGVQQQHQPQPSSSSGVFPHLPESETFPPPVTHMQQMKNVMLLRRKLMREDEEELSALNKRKKIIASGGKLSPDQLSLPVPSSLGDQLSLLAAQRQQPAPFFTKENTDDSQTELTLMPAPQILSTAPPPPLTEGISRKVEAEEEAKDAPAKKSRRVE